MAKHPSPTSLSAPPGYLKNESQRATFGRYVDGQNVRFVNTRPEKIAGWVRQTTGAAAGCSDCTAPGKRLCGERLPACSAARGRFDKTPEQNRLWAIAAVEICGGRRGFGVRKPQPG